jgi:hypothetical protein
MVLKKLLIIGLLVLGLAAAAVLLFYAGDHDDEYRNSVPPAGRPSELRAAPSRPIRNPTGHRALTAPGHRLPILRPRRRMRRLPRLRTAARLRNASSIGYGI